MNKVLIMLALFGLILMSGCTTPMGPKDYCVKKCAELGYGYADWVGSSGFLDNDYSDVECVCDTEKLRVITE